MIPFAGHDPNEHRREFKLATVAYELFQGGLDTMRIAERLRISEPKALKLVTLGRCSIIHQPSPYGVE